MSTLQEVFNHCAKHLLTQKAQSKRTTPKTTATITQQTMYLLHAPDGKRCALGCFIDPKHKKDVGFFNNVTFDPFQIYSSYADKLLKDSYIKDFYDYAKLSGWDLRRHGNRIMWQLQMIHDEYPPSLWAQQLRTFADKYNLNAKIIDDCAI